MDADSLKATFDRQATGYDRQWDRLAPIRDGLYRVVDLLFAGLPADARVLCVGVGTGAELAHLAERFPGWHFTAVDPSGPMLDRCRERAEREGFAVRCRFHEGYLDTLPADDAHDAATCFLVSHFILDPEARAAFFRGIADQLRPGGLLATSDLARGAALDDYEALLRLWLALMAGPDAVAERLEGARAGYARDVAILPPATVAAVIAAGGFEGPVQVYQAGLLHAWLAQRAPGEFLKDGTRETPLPA